MRRKLSVPGEPRRTERMQTMRAAIYHGVGDVRVEELHDPQPGPNDVVVEVAIAGICGTDFTEYNAKNVGAILPGRCFDSRRR